MIHNTRTIGRTIYLVLLCVLCHYLLFIVLSFDIAILIVLYCNVSSWRILRLSAY